jgi:hypothetical protein
MSHEVPDSLGTSASASGMTGEAGSNADFDDWDGGDGAVAEALQVDL